jgi:hypothetical protein
LSRGIMLDIMLEYESHSILYFTVMFLSPLDIISRVESFSPDSEPL